MLKALPCQGISWCPLNNGGWREDSHLKAKSQHFASLFSSFSSSSEARKAPVQRKTGRSSYSGCSASGALIIQASLSQSPILWAARTCIFYVLLQAGIAGRPSFLFLESEAEKESLFKWLEGLRVRNEDTHLKRVRNRWQTTTKGTLKRKFRVPTKTEGRRLLNAISSLLSDDDTFRDATSHKGCQIRRENAHAESVCCHNVRALFDELPTLHLAIEITRFPAGPITEEDYKKAERIERVLRTGNSI